MENDRLVPEDPTSTDGGANRGKHYPGDEVATETPRTRKTAVKKTAVKKAVVKEEKPPRNPNWRDTWSPNPEILRGGAVLRPLRVPHNADNRASGDIIGAPTIEEEKALLALPDGEELLKERYRQVAKNLYKIR